jgi:hypothetical protein
VCSEFKDWPDSILGLALQIRAFSALNQLDIAYSFRSKLTTSFVREWKPLDFFWFLLCISLPARAALLAPAERAWEPCRVSKIGARIGYAQTTAQPN